MKKRHVFIGLLVFLSVFFLIFRSIQLKYKQEKKEKAIKVFENQLVKALDLTFVNRDSNYAAFHTRIFKDTIVGYKMNIKEDNPGSEYFFIQSLLDLSHKVILQRNRYEYLPYENYIDYYDNGCLYFGSFGGSTMEHLCSDGSSRLYFEKYIDTLYYANKVLIYKDKAAVTSMNGIYVFDLKRERLLWKHQYKNFSDLYDGSSVIIGNKFYFTDIYRNFFCVNLDSLKIEWQIKVRRQGDVTSQKM